MLQRRHSQLLRNSAVRGGGAAESDLCRQFFQTGRHGRRQKAFFAAADSGFISQNVYLFCAASGLGTVVRDWVDRPSLAAKIKLREDQGIILVRTVGYPKLGPCWRPLLVFLSVQASVRAADPQFQIPRILPFPSPLKIFT
jgi:nitroreductase